MLLFDVISIFLSPDETTYIIIGVVLAVLVLVVLVILILACRRRCFAATCDCFRQQQTCMRSWSWQRREHVRVRRSKLAVRPTRRFMGQDLRLRLGLTKPKTILQTNTGIVQPPPTSGSRTLLVMGQDAAPAPCPPVQQSRASASGPFVANVPLDGAVVGVQSRSCGCGPNHFSSGCSVHVPPAPTTTSCSLNIDNVSQVRCPDIRGESITINQQPPPQVSAPQSQIYPTLGTMLRQEGMPNQIHIHARVPTVEAGLHPPLQNQISLPPAYTTLPHV